MRCSLPLLVRSEVPDVSVAAALLPGAQEVFLVNRRLVEARLLDVEDGGRVRLEAQVDAVAAVVDVEGRRLGGAHLTIRRSSMNGFLSSVSNSPPTHLVPGHPRRL